MKLRRLRSLLDHNRVIHGQLQDIDESIAFYLHRFSIRSIHIYSDRCFRIAWINSRRARELCIKMPDPQEATSLADGGIASTGMPEVKNDGIDDSIVTSTRATSGDY